MAVAQRNVLSELRGHVYVIAVLIVAGFLAITLMYGNFVASAGARRQNQPCVSAAQGVNMAKGASFKDMTPEELEQNMPIWVMSLKRATDRRQRVSQQMQEANIHKFEFFDGLDGSDPTAVSEQEVKKYFSGNNLKMWQEGRPYYRKKAAADSTHYRLLERVVARDAPAIILEDDGGPIASKNWYADLLAVLKELPDNWDLLYLNACYTTMGKKYTERLTVLKEGYCLIGYIPTPAFARAALAEAQREREHFIDVVYRIMFSEGRAVAFICQPPLVHFFHNITSLIGSEDEGKAVATKEDKD